MRQEAAQRTVPKEELEEKALVSLAKVRACALCMNLMSKHASYCGSICVRTKKFKFLVTC